MNLEYIDVTFKLEFERPFAFFTLPSIIFRSILGSRLHSMACIARQNTCMNCQFNQSCAYALIFETVIEKDTSFLYGRDRGSHPFRIKPETPILINQDITRYDLNMQLYGFAIKYLPYVYHAFQIAGERGIFKEKTKYAVKSVVVNNRNILMPNGNIETSFKPSLWSYTEWEPLVSGVRSILLQSPLRFKVAGAYTADFNAYDFLMCIYRRLITLCSLYGTYGGPEAVNLPENLSMRNSDLHRESYMYHSHRQQRILYLGGVSGSFELTGQFNSDVFDLLDFAHIFGAGKNTNFGFGNIAVNQEHISSL